MKCTNYGSIITGSNDGRVAIMSPTIPPKIIVRLISYNYPMNSVSKFRYLKKSSLNVIMNTNKYYSFLDGL